MQETPTHQSQQQQQQQPSNHEVKDRDQRKFATTPNPSNMATNINMHKANDFQPPAPLTTTAKLSLTEQQSKPSLQNLQSAVSKRHSVNIDSYLASANPNLRSELSTPSNGDVRSSNEKLLSYSYYSNLNYDKTPKAATSVTNKSKLLRYKKVQLTFFPKEF